MKKKFLICLSLVCMLSCAYGTDVYEDDLNYVPGEVIVKYKSAPLLLTKGGNADNKINFQSFENSIEGENLEIIETIPEANIALVSVSDDKTVEETIDLLENNKNIEYVEPNYRIQFFSIDSNDAEKDNLRGLEDIDWVRGYNIFPGISDSSVTGVVIGIIDNGVNYNHEDLVGHMWDGSNCKDEYGRYLGGCIHGYDFANNDKDPMSVDGSHGTHIAGTIAATINNGKGIIGVNPNAKIAALKVGDSLYDAILAIYFAKENGIKIINASRGAYATGRISYLDEAIEEFGKAGGLFINAAGNDDGEACKGKGPYPCCSDLDNVICVAATTSTGGLASFSNYNANIVDVGAPGEYIYSTVLDEKCYEYTQDFSGDLETFINSGWSKTGDVNISDERLVLANGAYFESPNISVYSGVYVAMGVGCDNGGSNNYLGLEINTGGDWHELLKYQNRTSDVLESNVGNVNSFKYRFVLHATNTSFTCKVRQVTIKGDYKGANDKYGYMHGTSMATPHVVGLASLAWSFRPDLSRDELKQAILDNGDSLNSLSGKTVSGKRINVYNTLVYLDNFAPSIPDNLQVEGHSISWDPSTDKGVGLSGYYYEALLSDDVILSGDIIDTGIDLELDDGIYLRRVQAIDIKGNKSDFATGYIEDVLDISIDYNFDSTDKKIIKANGTFLSGTMFYSTGVDNSCIHENDFVNTYIPGTDLVFDSELDNGIYVCFKAVFSNGAIIYKGTDQIEGIDLLPSINNNVVSVYESGHKVINLVNLFGAKEGNDGIDNIKVSEVVCSTGLYELKEDNISLSFDGVGSRNSLCTIVFSDDEDNTVNGTLQYYYDDIAPVCSVSYSPSSSTTANVVAKLTCDEAVTGATSYTFTTNGTYKFTVSDKAGNSKSFDANVSWITVNNGGGVGGSNGGGGGGGGGGGSTKVSTYVITWENYDGTVLFTGEVKEGATPKYKGIVPIRTGDDQYEYVFSGWNPAIEKAESDITYTAVYEAKAKEKTGDIDLSDIEDYKIVYFQEEHNAPDRSRYQEGDQQEILANGYTREFNNAYNFAYMNGITTIKDIKKANMNGELNRVAMAKMMSQYAINVLGLEPDITRDCNFADVDSQLDAQYNNGVTLACQLGLMGVGIKNFRPQDGVVRSEFGTALSRMLYGLEDGGNNYYSTHLAKLEKEGIIGNTDPKLQEKRGYVMIMLMRSAE